MLQVGRRLYVQITRIDEANNDLILSERAAWVSFDLNIMHYFSHYVSQCLIGFTLLQAYVYGEPADFL